MSEPRLCECGCGKPIAAHAKKFASRACKNRVTNRGRSIENRTPRVQRGGRIQRPVDADRFIPQRRLVSCLECFDLPHRRPATGCPQCGREHGELDVARASSCATSREAMVTWEAAE